MFYETEETRQVEIKSLIFELHGLTNYLIQDHEGEQDKTEVQKLWGVTENLIIIILKLIEYLQK